MNISVDEVRKNTAEQINDGADYSYITEELITSLATSIANGEVLTKSERYEDDGKTKVLTTEEVNSLAFQNGEWWFHEQCNTTPWWTVSSISQKVRIVNCANGLIRHNITY